MGYTRRFQQLKNRLAELESHFLPPIKVSGNYTKKELDNTRAFCVLTHAEIEAFFEDVAIFKTDTAIKSWVNSGKKKINLIVFHLATYCDKAPATKSVTPINLVHISHSNYQRSIRSNNGIKQNNLDLLFGKIGYEVDTTLASTLDSFGVQRGEIAHTSIKTHQPLDPQSEKNRITLIITGLQAFVTDFALYH
ncbi:HEPN domain-containing protein [Mucilaginibacter sp.]|uniref:HEPN domain-containing protein n=1 Tax=Mucilaginibacter sp. TaxID=1882438 RepID=UPI00262FCC23|nr:HEPN domain-containing protein [Mucilaginibacter sp.]MDB4924273.1 hypothetical protein [Mucilaginibacter sp.]